MMPPDSRRPRVFVAEDDSMIMDLITTRLELAGYAVSFARNGRDAIAGIHASQPAAVLLDINMPLLDGFGVLRALRENPPQTRAPVMVLTARHAAEDVQLALQLGASDYLAKPFDDARLLARVARLVRARGRGPSVARSPDAPPVDNDDSSVLL